MKDVFILTFFFGILSISASYGEEVDNKSSNSNKIYSAKEIPQYRLGIEFGGEILGLGPVIELYPKSEIVFGLAIGTNFGGVTGAVRSRVYPEIGKSSAFIGAAYGGWYLIAEESFFFPKFLDWVYVNFGYRFISKSNSAFSIYIGGLSFINNTLYGHRGAPCFGIEFFW